MNRTQVAAYVNRTRQTIWRWEAKGLMPPPDGHDPYGNAVWRIETIDGFLAPAKAA